jgi:hypothetical protein
MSDESRFATLDPRYEAFLFAEIGEQKNGMPITMISALARLGLDPWDEAGRLATLPAAAALAAVTALVARISGLTARKSEIPKLSARLVPLLAQPATARGIGSGAAPAAPWWAIDARWVMAASAVAVLVAVVRQLFG